MSKNLLIIIGILCAVIAVAGCDPTPQKETQRIKGSREEVEKSWHEFIAIMKTGDAEKVKAASTERGYNSLLDPYEKDNKKRFFFLQLMKQLDFIEDIKEVKLSANQLQFINDFEESIKYLKPNPIKASKRR